ncbi:PD-(D/E)XK nuclease family protein [Desulfosporosinus burensis]
MARLSLVKKVDLSVAVEVDSRGNELAGALFNQFNTFHSRDYRPDKEVERIAFLQKTLEFDLVGVKTPRPSTYIFSPSGASKCSRELYLKALGTKIEDDKYPYHRRWTRNSTAVHEAVQKDLLYMSKVLPNPAFTVKMAENGLPCWEENLKTFVEVVHNGVEFAVLGMMDGVLNYTKDGAEIGFEFKTKSNSIGQVGNYKMKEPAPYHKEQCTAYSILFGMSEFILMYEAVAKDQWNKGAEAKSDIRTFYYKVTEEAKTALLDKFANVVNAVEAKETPPKQEDKCVFCQYKHLCEGVD